MRINVNRVPEEGLKLDGTYDPQLLDMARPDAVPAAPISVTGLARKQEDELIVEVSARCVLECTCARCLTCFESVIKKHCLFTYDVSTRHVVDITEEVREELLLDYPLISVCEPACRGLCPRCGENLNDSDCGHAGATASEDDPGESDAQS